MLRYPFLAVFGLAALFGAHCQADVIYDVALNTTPLIGNSNAPFALDFQLTSGDTSSGVVNTVTLSQFTFGNGGSAASGGPFPNSGNALGDLSSTVALNTSGGTFFNEFSQFFTPGSMLMFQLNLTNNAQPPPTPDEFTFQLIDKTDAQIATTDPSGSDSLLVIDLTGSPLKSLIYTTNGDGITIAPQLTSPVPEPAAAWLFVCSGTLSVIVQKGRNR